MKTSLRVGETASEALRPLLPGTPARLRPTREHPLNTPTSRGITCQDGCTFRPCATPLFLSDLIQKMQLLSGTKADLLAGPRKGLDSWEALFKASGPVA